MCYSVNSLNLNYTKQKIKEIAKDTISLYIVINNNNTNINRLKLTLKTILMSISKKDYNTFNKYCEIFDNKVKTYINGNNSNDIQALCNLFIQIKVILNNNNTELIINKDIIEKCFYSLQEQLSFYLFRLEDNNNTFLTNYDLIEDKQQFKEYYQNIICECADEVINEWF